MKGLILKDLYNLKKTGKNFLFILAIFAFTSIASKNPYSMCSMIFILGSMIPINSYAFDDHYKWEKFACVLPLSSKEIVLSKFILAIIFSVVSSVISVLIFMFFPNKDYEQLAFCLCVFFTIGITFTSILLPLFMKYGIEKGRILIFAFAVIPVIIGFAGKRFLSDFDPASLDKYVELVWFSPLFGIVIAVISIVICIKILDNKEF